MFLVIKKTAVKHENGKNKLKKSESRFVESSLKERRRREGEGIKGKPPQWNEEGQI